MRSYRVLGYRTKQETCPCGNVYEAEDRSSRVESFALAVSGADARRLFDLIGGVKAVEAVLLASMITDCNVLARMRIRCDFEDGNGAYYEQAFCFMTDPKPVKGRS